MHFAAVSLPLYIGLLSEAPRLSMLPSESIWCNDDEGGVDDDEDEDDDDNDDDSDDDYDDDGNDGDDEDGGLVVMALFVNHFCL